MNLQPAHELIYALEAEIARLINSEAKQLAAKKALEHIQLNCQDSSEWLLTAEKREAEQK